MKYSEALSRAAALCSDSEKCASDIKKKLDTWEVDESEAKQIILKLKEEKFIDHQRFTNFYVRDKLKFNKWGRRKLEFELRNKGIEAEIITIALKSIINDEYFETLYNILEQKLRQVKNKDPYQTKAALIRFALSKGFDGDLVYTMVDKVIKTQQNSEL
jgi:regulatory protein